MGLALDYAIIGIFFFFLVSLAYFLALSFFGIAYSLLKYRTLAFIKRSANLALKASLASSALNCIAITIISIIVISNALKGGIPGATNMIGIGYPIGALALAAIIAGKLIVYGTISTFFWLIVALVGYAYFSNKKVKAQKPQSGRKASGKKNRK